MMSYEEIVALLESAGADLSVDYGADEIEVLVEDFVGFDEEYCEILRALDDEDLVDSIESQLEESAMSVSGDYYRYFHFDGFVVVWGYASYDI